MGVSFRVRKLEGWGGNPPYFDSQTLSSIHLTNLLMRNLIFFIRLNSLQFVRIVFIIVITILFAMLLFTL